METTGRKNLLGIVLDSVVDKKKSLF